MALINTGIQYLDQDAQPNLPVLPNNGNPAGAYNMARPPVVGRPTPAPTPITKPAPMPIHERYPWLKPSQSIENVRQMLEQRRQGNQNLPVMPRRYIP